jgi:hypothetical protein
MTVIIALLYNYNYIYIVQPPSRSYQQKLGVSILGLLQKKMGLFLVNDLVSAMTSSEGSKNGLLVAPFV